ncbi:MAG: hypothetical protein IJJ06_10575 [Mogibacterium sp.]|nr:hypothetical protein [Mogibacterium sp.]
MLIKKLYNARRDLTETRNNTRTLTDALEKVSNTLVRVSNKLVSRNSYKEVILAEFRRRDIWERAAAETKRFAAGRPVWVIKCPTYESWLKTDIPFRADYAYCMTLKKYLEKEGIYAVIQMYEDWYCDAGADVEILMGSYRDYHPAADVQGRTNVMWLVCHPENLSKEAADRYDLILVDSGPLAEEMRGGYMAETEPFIVTADTDLFYRDDSPAEYERVFVGHTRGVNRNCVKWCSDNKIELDVWGGGWEKYYKDDPYIHLHGIISYDETAEIYRKAKIIINDHHHEMLKTGMINNRCPEVLLCGKTMLCDWSQGIEDEFGDLFTYYHDEKDFIEALERAEENYDRLCKKIDEKYDELVSKYSFETGIKRLIKLVESVQNKNKAGL